MATEQHSGSTRRRSTRYRPQSAGGDRTDRWTKLSHLGDVIAAELGLSEEKLRRLQELY
jgi:hypothetical protein